MNRIMRQADAEALAAALDLMPMNIRQRLEGTHVLTRTDPAFVGLHFYDSIDGTDTPFSQCAHVAWQPTLAHLPRCQRDTTIVLPVDYCFGLWTITHEFGHVLHEQIGYEHVASPISVYARTNKWEAFAEAFASWCLPDMRPTWGDEPLPVDPATVHLFEDLAA